MAVDGVGAGDFAGDGECLVKLSTGIIIWATFLRF